GVLAGALRRTATQDRDAGHHPLVALKAPDDDVRVVVAGGQLEADDVADLLRFEDLGELVLRRRRGRPGAHQQHPEQAPGVILARYRSFATAGRLFRPSSHLATFGCLSSLMPNIDPKRTLDPARTSTSENAPRM